MEIGFFIKKIVSYFVEPFGMVLLLLLLGLYFLFFKRDKFAKIFLSLGFITMFVYSYQPFSNFLILNLENKYPKYDYKEKIKYIHVLGSGHNDDLSQPLSSRLGSASIKRSSEGMIIHLNTKGSKIIFTGYEGEENSITTAKVNADYAMSLGIKEENLVVNGKPKDTMEEALFVQTIVGNESFVLVTSATHMPRSMMLFESLGLHPIAAPTNFYKDEKSDYMSLPTLGNFKKSQIAVHEYLGILWSYLKSLI